MLTKVYTRSEPLSVTIANVASDIMQLLLKRQMTIAQTYEPHLKPIGRRKLQSHPGPHLADKLATMQPQISASSNQVDILLDYPATIRFLDLKKTKTGAKKRRYTAIYNRPLFGLLYGRGYSLSSMVNLALQKEYQQYLSNLQETMKIIEL